MSGGGYVVQIEALLTDAKRWGLYSREVWNASTRTAGLTMSGIQAGPFGVILGPYNSTVQEVAVLTHKGATIMDRVGLTLTQVANEYAQAEGDNAQRFGALQEEALLEAQLGLEG